MKESIVLAMTALLLLSGCAAQSVRIYKVGASGNYPFIGGAVADGCVVLVEGEPEGLEITYQDEKCQVWYGQPAGEMETDL